MSQQDADPMPFSEAMAELRAAIRAVVVPPLDLIAAGADPRDAAAELADPLRGLEPTAVRGPDPAFVQVP